MKERIPFLDYLRVVACFLVMLVHASENFYAADSSGLAGNVSMLANESNRFWVAFYDGGFGRVSVPLFMIMSAFLLVNKIKKGCAIMRRIKAPAFWTYVLVGINAWLGILLAKYSWNANVLLAWGGMSWEQSVQSLKMIPFNFPMMAGHLWFMYPLIGLYLIIPVISPWLERATAKEERIFIGLFAFTTLIPWLHRFVTPELWGECFWNHFTAFWYCSGYIGYLVLAHYIRVHLDWSRKRKLIIGSLCFIVGGAFTAWSFWLKGVPGQVIETPLLEWSWEFCTLNVLVATFGMFLLFTCIQVRKVPTIITDISKLSYGMYLMHMFYLAVIAQWMINGDVANPRIPVCLAIPAIAILSYLCSYVTTKVLSYLPGSKYIVGA